MEIANEELRRFDMVIIDKNSKKVKRLNKSGRTRPPNFSHKTHYFSNSEFPRITSRFLNSAAKLTGFTVTGTDGSTTYDSESSDPQTFDATTLFVTDPATGIGAITYSITAGDNVATIDSSTGLVTITGTGEITIAAIVAETATTQAASGTAVLTITAA